MKILVSVILTLLTISTSTLAYDTSFELYREPIIRKTDTEEPRFFSNALKYFDEKLTDNITPTSIGFNDFEPDGSHLVKQGVLLDAAKSSLREIFIRLPITEEVLGHVRGFFRKFIRGTIGNTRELEIGTQSVLSPANTRWIDTIREEGTQFGGRLGNSQYLYLSKRWLDKGKDEIAITHLRYHLYSFPDSILRPDRVEFGSHRVELLTELPLDHGWALVGGITYSSREQEVEKGQKFLGSLRLEKKFRDGAFVIGTEIFDRLSVVSALTWNFR